MRGRAGLVSARHHAVTSTTIQNERKKDRQTEERQKEDGGQGKKRQPGLDLFHFLTEVYCRHRKKKKRKLTKKKGGSVSRHLHARFTY